MNNDDDILPGKLLKIVANELLRQYEAILRPYGLGAAGIPVLNCLDLGIANTQSALAEVLQVEQPSMAQCLSRLERDGFIVRVATQAHDKRIKEVQLTDSAKAIIPEAKARLRQLNDRAMADFSEAETQQLRQLLKRIHHNLITDETI